MDVELKYHLGSQPKILPNLDSILLLGMGRTRHRVAMTYSGAPSVDRVASSVSVCGAESNSVACGNLVLA